jgi:hypothetical protein
MTEEEKDLLNKTGTMFLMAILGPFLVRRNLERVLKRQVRFSEAWGAIQVVSWLSYYAGRNVSVAMRSADDLREAGEKAAASRKKNPKSPPLSDDAIKAFVDGLRKVRKGL